MQQTPTDSPNPKSESELAALREQLRELRSVTKEGWLTEHPTTGLQVEVVTAAWAKAQINKRDAALKQKDEKARELLKEAKSCLADPQSDKAIWATAVREIMEELLAIQPSAIQGVAEQPKKTPT